MWEIWAAGNNAWGQLDWGHPDRTATIQGRHGNPEATDYWTFRPVLGRARLEALTLRAGEFRTHVKEHATYITSGEEDTLLEMIEYADKRAVDPRTLKSKRLASRHYPQLLKPAGIAMSGTGRIIDIKGIQTQLSPYPSSTSSSPTTTEAPPALVLPPGTTDIVAGATHFACLAAGLVYTWGDPRHTAPLGRLSPSTSRLDSCSASLPALVTDLSELAEGLSLASPNGENDIFKIAAGGYTTAALTVTGDCYIWGDRSQGWTSTPEPVDMEVRDVAVGEEFVVLLDGKGRVWVRGKGASGELGLGVGREEAREWTRVPVDLEEGKMVRGVVAGPRCCLLLVDIPAEEETESEEEGRGGGFGKEGSGADEEIED